MILITGASGTVGSEVLKQAAAAKLPLRAAFQSQAKAKSAPAGTETVVMDYTKPETIRAALKGVEKVFLVGPPILEVAKLEAGLVDEAKNAGLRHLVKLSAMGGRAAIFTGLHRDSEEHIEASGIPYTFLRPNGFMQNYINYNGATISAQSAFYGCQGNAAVSHVDVRDIAAAGVVVLANAGHEGKAYSLTGPEALTNDEIAEKLSRAVGRAIRYVDLTPQAFKQGMLAAGVPEWSADAILDLQRYYREGHASKIDPAVEQLIGRKATTFDQFARDVAAAFRMQSTATT